MIAYCGQLVRSETSDMVKEGLGRAWLFSKFAKIIYGNLATSFTRHDLARSRDLSDPFRCDDAPRGFV